MVTGGFRTAAGMNAALDSSACDFVGIARPFAIIEIIWYAAQFKEIAKGNQPNPKLSPLKVFLNYVKGNVKAVIKGQINSRKSA